MHIERSDRVNWSTLKHIGVSPKHYIHNLTVPRADTEALQLGRVTHCAVFERDELDKRYVTCPNFHRGMNDDTAIAKGYAGGKRSAELWELNRESTGAEVVPVEIMDRAHGMTQAILLDPIAGPYVTTGYSEHRIEWIDEPTGILCRGRVDHVNGCLADLKTTRSIVTCERDAARLGYHAQLAWYSDGLEAAGIAVESAPRLVFVESAPPYDVLVLTFDESDLSAGRSVYRRYLERLAECRKIGVWPGVSGGVMRRINLPEWAVPEVELTLDGVALEV